MHWYGIDLMNTSLYTPGPWEAKPKPVYTHNRSGLARDRNLIVPWAALKHQLLNIFVVSRIEARYRCSAAGGSGA